MRQVSVVDGSGSESSENANERKVGKENERMSDGMSDERKENKRQGGVCLAAAPLLVYGVLHDALSKINRRTPTRDLVPSQNEEKEPQRYSVDGRQ